MFDLRLLFDVGGLLLRQTLGAFGLIEIVIAAVLGQFLLRQFDGVRCGGIQEVAVMGDDDLRTGQGSEMVFQPQHGF